MKRTATATHQSIIMGIDPGTNVMGYALIAITGKSSQLIAMGAIELNKYESHYLRLRRIYDRVLQLVEQYLPDEVALEAPFFGKNVQSMLKLGRAQGVAMAAALSHDIPVTEYEPRKIKQAITGNGGASKEQVREMLRRTLNITPEQMHPTLDATDALAAAMCHHYEKAKPISSKHASSWKEYIARNPDRVK